MNAQINWHNLINERNVYDILLRVYGSSIYIFIISNHITTVIISNLNSIHVLYMSTYKSNDFHTFDIIYEYLMFYLKIIFLNKKLGYISVIF